MHKKLVFVCIVFLVIVTGCGKNETGYYKDGADIHITESGTYLKDMSVLGDLYVDASVGSGEFYIENCEITGTIYVNGGGPNSGYLINVIGKDLYIESETNPNVVLSMNTAIEGVQLACDCRLETDGAVVEKVTVNQPITEKSINILMKGDYPEVSLESTANVKIDGTVSLFAVLKKAKLSSINMVDDSKVYYYSCYGQSVTISGGTIIEAWINAEYCSLPEKTEATFSEVGVADVKVGEVHYEIPAGGEMAETQNAKEQSEENPKNEEQSENPKDIEEQAEDDKNQQEPKQEDAKQEEPIKEPSAENETVLKDGYPKVSIGVSKITINIAANESCTVYSLVEAEKIFQQGTTATNVRDGISKGAGMVMEDGNTYIVIHNSFQATASDGQLFTISMEMGSGTSPADDGEDPSGEGSPDDGGPPEDAENQNDGPPPDQGSVGVFVVVMDVSGNLSQVYSFH